MFSFNLSGARGQLAAVATILLWSLGPLSSEASAEPTAIVEEVEADGSKLRVFDFLSPGQRIELKSDQKLVLGYLQSCVREVIQGGTVNIGARESEVSGGLVSRELVECDGGYTQLTEEQAAKSGVIVFRAPPGGQTADAKRLYSTMPLFAFRSKPASLKVTPVDGGNPVTLTPEGKIVDLAALNKPLQAGRRYEVAAGDVRKVIEIDQYATVGGSLLGRLVQF